MARMNFNEYQEAASSIQANTGNQNQVGLFALKNDGDEAIVRIMHDSDATFDIVLCHNVKIGERYRKVNCVRDPREPVDKCPLCASGASIQQRMFVHMIKYDKANDGTVIATPIVWDRSAKEYGKKLYSMIQEYGPLSDYIFKIRRNGAAGDMGTTYELMLANPNIYRNDLYPKLENAFDTYNAVGTIVIDRPAEDIAEFMTTGNFPQRQQSVNNEYNSVPAQPATGNYVPADYAQAFTPQSNQMPPTASPVYSQPSNTSTPVSAAPTAIPNTGVPNTQVVVNRPTRYY